MSTQTLLEEAALPTTSPQRLSLLASDSDPSVRAQARLHPQCPPQVLSLLELAESSPELLTPGHLEVLATLGPSAQELAARHPHTPDQTLVALGMRGLMPVILNTQVSRAEQWFMQRAQQDFTLAQYLAQNRSVPWNLRRSARRTYRVAAATPLKAVAPADGFTPAGAVVSADSVREKLRRRREPIELTLEESLLIENDVRLQRLAARHPLLPVELLVWLDQRFPHGQARETLLTRLATHALPAKTLLQFSREGDWEERAAVARNPALPEPGRERLRDDADWWVRAAVTENPHATPQDLQRLAQDTEHVTIREGVAGHPNTPGEILTRLATDGERAVRLQVARNPSAPPEALEYLAGDGGFMVREAVAAHALCPPASLAILAADPNERVRFVARLRTGPISENAAAAALATRRRQVKLALSAAPGTPRPAVEQLARDRNPQVRAQVALHPQLPDGTRRYLISDPAPAVSLIARALDDETPPDQLAFLPRHDARVRQALSRNPQAPEPVLDDLSEDPLLDVRLNVILNPAAPGTALKRRLVDQPLRPDIRRHPRYQGEVQDHLHQLEYAEAGHSDATPDALRLLAQSDAGKVRRRVARHANTPDDTLLLLAQDSDTDIRRAILKRSQELPYSLQRLLAADALSDIRSQLILRPELLPSVMLHLAARADEDEGQLVAIAQHANVTPEVLTALARHAQSGARRAAAEHPLTPAPLLVQLVNDPQDHVQRGVLRNPVCPPEALMALIRHPRLHLDIAQHPLADGRVLESLVYDGSYDRYIRVERWVKTTPLWKTAPVERWRRWMTSRASQRAFAQRNVFMAVIEHERVTLRALRFISRLNHPDISPAIYRRRQQLSGEPSSEVSS